MHHVKMDTKEQLLLSEGVCRQVGIVTYQREVLPGQGEAGGDGAGGEVYVPTDFSPQRMQSLM